MKDYRRNLSYSFSCTTLVLLTACGSQDPGADSRTRQQESRGAVTAHLPASAEGHRGHPERGIGHGPGSHGFGSPFWRNFRPGPGHHFGHGGPSAGSNGNSGGAGNNGGNPGSGGSPSGSGGTTSSAGGMAGGYYEAGVCGDGISTWWDEQCDDGNSASGDGCSASCQIESGWVCVGDEGCRRALCGDGFQDGYSIDGDPSEPAMGSGNGDAGGGPSNGTGGGSGSDGTRYIWEECDDSNAIDGDGCSASCTVESGFACATPGEPCHPVVCGDGLQESYSELVACDTPGIIGTGGGAAGSTGGAAGSAESCSVYHWESCDDGNQESGDGCSASCEQEQGFSCPQSGVPCHEVRCGDGYQDTVVEEVECDGPGGGGSGSGGSAGGATGDTDTCYSYRWESCDDGNSESNDGCDASCQIEPGFICVTPWDGQSTVAGAPQQCHQPTCGDGVVDEYYPGEGTGSGGTSWAMPDVSSGGNGDNGDNSAGGNGGNSAGGNGSGGAIPYPETQEECDDGNTISGDGCSETCRIE